MILGFDLDGVVVDSPQKVVIYINERLGLNLTMDNFTTYCMEDALPDQYKWIVSAAFKDPEMWRTVNQRPRNVAHSQTHRRGIRHNQKALRGRSRDLVCDKQFAFQSSQKDKSLSTKSRLSTKGLCMVAHD